MDGRFCVGNKLNLKYNQSVERDRAYTAAFAYYFLRPK